MKLHWVDPSNKTGANFGYGVHSTRLRASLVALGRIDFVDSPEAADLVVHVTYPAAFEAIPGKINLGFIQTELDDVGDPAVWRGQISKADVLVTSSRLSQEVERRHFRGPVYFCPLGVDSAQFSYVDRELPRPDNPFVFLWVNNFTDSKGAGWMDYIWDEFLSSGFAPRNALLYMKGSGEPDGVVDTSQARSRHVIYDTRKISVEDLAAMYQSAHVFLNTSHGDGFGLTQFEALSTGIPSIWTHWSSFPDYLDSSMGYPVTKFDFRGFSNPSNPSEMAARGAYGDPYEYIRHIVHIKNHYDEAVARGKNASQVIRERYTWAAAGARFLDILREVCP